MTTMAHGATLAIVMLLGLWLMARAAASLGAAQRRAVVSRRARTARRGAGPR